MSKDPRSDAHGREADGSESATATRSTATTPSALVFGEALWDLLPSGSVLGGAPLNFAYRLGSLGIPTRLVSQVGDDKLGRETLERMRALGMDTSLVSVSVALPTATVVVELDENRQPSYTIVTDVAYDAVPWTDELESAASDADILCFGTLAQRDQRSRDTLRRIVDSFSGGTVLVDINLRPECWTNETVTWSMAQGTIAKLNDDELKVLAQIYQIPPVTTADQDELEVLAHTAARLKDLASLEVIVVTLGERGAFAIGADAEPVFAPGFTVEVDDPCGSGDAFAGMFVASLVAGRPLQESLARANALGALVATQPGATGRVDQSNLDRLLKEKK